MESDADAGLFPVLVHHRESFDDRVDGCEPLLAVDDQTTGNRPFRAHSDLPSFGAALVLPEEQITDRETAVHRIEQVSHLGRLPDERALNVGQANVPGVDLLDQPVEGIAAFLENRVRQDWTSRGNSGLSVCQRSTRAWECVRRHIHEDVRASGG